MKFTFKKFNEQYPDDDACLDKLFQELYEQLGECPKCHQHTKFYRITTRKCYSCKNCNYQLYPLAGTILEKTRTSLKDWFYAFFLFSNSKNGLSAKELERQIGVTYKTAWRMCNKIRQLCHDNIELSGLVEIDETYIGGKEKNKHFNKKIKNSQGRSLKGKVPVVGAVEYNGNITAKVTSDTQEETIKTFLDNHVKIRTEIVTDEYRSYNHLVRFGYVHYRVNHSQNKYVIDGYHTNTIEGFWSQLKRSMHGTYHHVSNKYLQQYVDEFTYKRNMLHSDKSIFNDILYKVNVVCRQ